MQIDELEIENFKLFAKENFSFDKQFNLIIGENGSGKTSLLSAVAVALGGWAHAYIKDLKNKRPIEDNEVREIQIDNSFDKTKTTSITAKGTANIIDRNKSPKLSRAKWTRRKSDGFPDTLIDGQIKYGNYPQWYNFNMEDSGSDVLSYIESGKKINLPLIAFYECNRLWLSENELNVASSAKKRYSRFDPYVDCFHTGADHKAVGEWILKHELASLQQKEDTPVFTSIKTAAKASIQGCVGLKFDFDKSRIMIEFKDGATIPFEHLSDGQRTMLGLFCDLARRAAILNPHLLGEANEKTKGVVLIDELDLHLHPKWQRSIIESLLVTFPNIQFICTTHSPFLIQSLNKGRLIQLGEVHTGDFVDSSLEDIVEDIQGVELPQKSKRYKNMMEAAEQYYKKLHECADVHSGNIEELKNKLDEFTIPFSDDAAFSALLKFERNELLINKMEIDDEAGQ
jgi:predicted ATP-binding protein involved in virulence